MTAQRLYIIITMDLNKREKTSMGVIEGSSVSLILLTQATLNWLFKNYVTAEENFDELLDIRNSQGSKFIYNQYNDPNWAELILS